MLSFLGKTRRPAPVPEIEESPAEPGAAPDPSSPSSDEERFLDLKMRLHQQLIDEINLSVIERMPRAQFDQEIGELVGDMLRRDETALSEEQRRILIVDIIDELLGLGPLEPLLKDPTVSDIIVNTSRQVSVERGGKIEITPVRFKDEGHLLRIINKIVSTVGRRIDESQPITDARLPDGSRVNAVIPPVAVDGSLLAIRKFAKIPFDLARLVACDAITPEVRQVLEAIVRGRLNVLISGGTGSGKTTLLNAMSGCVGHGETVVTIEDAAELQLQQPLVRRMETRPANAEGRGEITQRDLVRAALRMRPDRIIVGEVRGGEAIDMLQAMNTGHEGSMSTIHANTPRDALSRLEQMIGMGGVEMAPRTIRSQIASAIHVVVQLTRGSDGKRRLVSLQEITGMEGDVISTNEIFRFRRVSTDENGTIRGVFEATGIRPAFAESLASQNLALPSDIFAPHRLD
ncbi:MAG TPA: CpaF family protein [Magnetospirillum sp.]|jgi:pilus assembly protein CpaF|nr:CpaF family protein [Magnetospirillum sp.]